MKDTVVNTMIRGTLTGLIAVLLWPAAAAAAEGPGTTGAGYLNYQIGAKSIAMGETKAAIAGDPFNWMSNPGAFHYMTGSGVGVSHSEWIADTRYSTATYHHRFNDMIAVSAGLVYTFHPEIMGYDELGTETGELKSNNYQTLVGFGFTPHRSITVGLNIKYFREKLAEWSGGGIGVDIGALYTFDRPRVSVGFAAQNLGPDIRFDSVGEPLPLTVRFGLGYAVTAMEENLEFSTVLDLAKPRYEGIFLSAGCEVEIYRMFAVRAGYSGQETRPGSGFTMGGGVRVHESLSLDYAWTPLGDLGNFHRISLFYNVTR